SSGRITTPIRMAIVYHHGGRSTTDVARVDDVGWPFAVGRSRMTRSHGPIELRSATTERTANGQRPTPAITSPAAASAAPGAHTPRRRRRTPRGDRALPAP